MVTILVADKVIWQETILKDKEREYLVALMIVIPTKSQTTLVEMQIAVAVVEMKTTSAMAISVTTTIITIITTIIITKITVISMAITN